jgi:phosphoglycerate dehydrogenase-like enzyme
MPFNILIVDGRAPNLDVETAVTGDAAAFVDAKKLRFADIDAATWANADAIVTARVPIRADEIPHLARCKIIVRFGVGFDIIDLEGCGRAGIAVCNIPDYGTTEVADSAIAMMLSFARGTTAYDAALRGDLAGGWTHTKNVTAKRLRGACFGVIGLGRIGTAAALRARAFGMDIAFYDPYLPNGAELALGFRRARTRDELLGMADVVSMHTPLTDETRNIIDASAVAAAKQGAIILNTSRGPVCDTRALVDGLKSGKLLAVGLDVLPKEPASLDDPFVAAWQANEPWIRGRALLAPHSGFFSPDAFTDMRHKGTETVFYYLRDGKLANCVNAEFLRNPRRA